MLASRKKPFILAAHALLGRPYDGHTPLRSLAQAPLNGGVKIKTAVADKGYRVHEARWGARIVVPGQHRGPPAKRRWRRTRLRRRRLIEALIERMKADELQLAQGYRRRCDARDPLCRRPKPPLAAASERRFFAPQCTYASGVVPIALGVPA